MTLKHVYKTLNDVSDNITDVLVHEQGLILLAGVIRYTRYDCL